MQIGRHIRPICFFDVTSEIKMAVHIFISLVGLPRRRLKICGFSGRRRVGFAFLRLRPTEYRPLPKYTPTARFESEGCDPPTPPGFIFYRVAARKEHLF